ncbi:MAG: hypothetical protein H6740_18200 [Alphaproteobacteria bacterium]|nr:hypothetical protein [Alphaproteobacteria bacterium]
MMDSEGWHRPKTEAWTTCELHAPLEGEHFQPYFRCSSELAVDVDTLADWMVTDILKSLPEWNEDYRHGEVIAQLGPGERIMRTVYGAPYFFVGAREYLVYQADLAVDGVRYELTTDDWHDRVPALPGLIRPATIFCSKEFRPIPGGTRYTLIWKTDPRGVIGRLPLAFLNNGNYVTAMAEHRLLRARFGAP